MDALRWAPTIPVYTADGSYSAPLLSSQAFDNPVAIVNLLNNRTTTDYLARQRVRGRRRAAGAQLPLEHLVHGE